MKDIVTIGEILIDLTFSGKGNGIPVYTANPGGAPANVAVAAARLGADTAFIGKVGKDYYGDFLRTTLQKNNVDTSFMLTDDSARTTLAVVSLSGRCDLVFVFFGRSASAYQLHRCPVVADCQCQLLRNNVLSDHIQHKQLRHFPDDQPCKFCGIRLFQHLSGRKRVCGRSVGLDRCDLCRLPAPCMVDHDFSLHAQCLI